MSLHDYEPSLRLLRDRGCRCPLMWDAEKREPRPFTRCEVPMCDDKTRCAYVASLIFARNEETANKLLKATGEFKATGDYQ